MKHFYLIATVFAFYFSSAQNITFADNNFKNRLLQSSSSQAIVKNLSGNYFAIDANADGQISVSEAQQVSWMYVRARQISSMVGIEHFTNMTTLHCDDNFITNLNLSGCTSLTAVYCNLNYLTALDVSGCTNLSFLDCSDNNLSSLSLNNNTNLAYLTCSDNQLGTLNCDPLINLQYLICDHNQLNYLDLNACRSLTNLNCSNNPLLSLYIKNGLTQTVNLYSLPSLAYVCCDEAEATAVQTSLNNNGFTNCVVNSYCSFTPGGQYYTVNATNSLDGNGNGCDGEDLPYSFMRYSISGIAGITTSISDNNGLTSINLPAGNYTVSPILENPEYFIVSPQTMTYIFPSQSTPQNQNFCVTNNGIHNDLEVVVLPLNSARPGFNARYKIIYKNKGNAMQSGTVTLSYDDPVFDIVSLNPTTSSQSPNLLTWNFENLLPFETREIAIELNLNSPMETPSVNIGYDLGFNAIINPIPGDEYYYDNQCNLKQVVVGSYDPNDKRCIEGDVIPPAAVGQYVHYIIRFENTGNYAAQNVVVVDNIDLSKFDIATLIPTHASHSFVTRITQGNKVEFIFEGINLDFQDATNDGYIAFKIKTLSTLVLGDTFSNSASIYFDYNFPIITNIAVTAIQALAGSDFQFAKYFALAPNPVRDILSIKMHENLQVTSVNVYNAMGQLVLVKTHPGQDPQIDVSRLQSGNFFLKIYSEKGVTNSKFVKI